MDKNKIIVLLTTNYKLEKSMIDYTIDVLNDLRVSDFKEVFTKITNSKKFDYISKLHDAVDGYKKNILKLDDKESIKVQTYSDKLFSKTTSVFDEIDYQVSIGKDINSTQMTNFIYANFDDKERAVLKQIGDRNRLLFMIRGTREALREQINKIVEDLSLEKKKAVLGLSMTQKTDNEKKMLELVRGVNKK